MRELVGANPQVHKKGEQLTVPVAVAIPSEDRGSSGGGSGPLSTQPRTHTVKPSENLTVLAISSRHPRRRPTSKSFAEDGEKSKLSYKLSVHPLGKHIFILLKLYYNEIKRV